MQTKAAKDAFDAAMLVKSLDKIEELLWDRLEKGADRQAGGAAGDAGGGGLGQQGLAQPPSD